MRHHRRLLVVAAIVLAASVAAATIASATPTYATADELPAPETVLRDRLRDVDVYGMARLPHTDWEDILEVRAYTTSASLIFVVLTSGELPQASSLLHSGTLLVLIDLDGDPGHVSFSPYTFGPEPIRRAGYEFALGQNGAMGLWRATSVGRSISVASPIEHWRDEGLLYLEVSWEDLGGRPAGEIAFFLFTARFVRSTVTVVMDRAPNGGAAYVPNQSQR